VIVALNMISRFPNEDPDHNQARTSEPVPGKTLRCNEAA
jgi:hypothetical protein